jgi:lysozyme family protein
MIEDFKKLIGVVLSHEGGYVFDEKDPGGETYMGISRKNHPKWAGWVFVDFEKANKKMKRNDYINCDVLNGLALLFYYVRFYKPLNIQGLDIEKQLNIFDFAVNAGKNRAIKLAQKIAGVKQDGIIGNVTRRAIDIDDDFVSCYKLERKLFYISLSNKKPALKKFLNGWLMRVDNLKINDNV